MHIIVSYQNRVELEGISKSLFEDTTLTVIIKLSIHTYQLIIDNKL